MDKIELNEICENDLTLMASENIVFMMKLKKMVFSEILVKGIILMLTS